MRRRFDRYGWYPAPAPKKPPPKRGIKAKHAGSTWWGQRWIEALERISHGYGNRLARGRSYARAGRTHDLVVNAGSASARVTGSRATPYKVEITLAKLSDATWQKAICAIAGEARFSADLLAGEMPREIDKAFGQAGASLFPAGEGDLKTKCSCPDWANPCKHVAATHYVLGEALDQDPFLLFELRGRSKERVLEALRSARSGAPVEAPRSETLRAPAVKLGRLKPSDYDRTRAALPELHLTFAAEPQRVAVLRQLGAPRGWRREAPPAEVFGPLIADAAERARSIALGDPENEAAPRESPAVVRKQRKK